MSGLKGPNEIKQAAIKAVNRFEPLPRQGELQNDFSSTYMDRHDQEHSHDQEQGLRGNHGQTVESPITNLPSAGPLSFERQVYNTRQAPWVMDAIQRPYFESTNASQGTSRASQRRLLTFPEGQAHPRVVFDPYTWQGLPEGYYGTGPSVPEGLLPSEDQPDALLNDPVYGRGNTSADPVPGRILAGYVPNVINTSSGYSEIDSGPINFLDPTMNPIPRGAWANSLLHHSNTDVLWEWTDSGDGPARDVIKIWSPQRRGVRSPPQKNEKDLLKLFLRLMVEGADIRAAVILRDVIFPAGVTRAALMAPIQEREMSIDYGGAKWMWQLLLEPREVAPDKKKFFCLLCPVSGRRGWNHERDTVRHFNKNHFGFSFPCENENW